MVACKIIEKKKYNEYILKVGGKEMSLVLEFYGVDVGLGDSIILDENLLDKNAREYAQPYAFEVMGPASGNVKLLTSDFAIISTKDSDYKLRRIYG